MGGGGIGGRLASRGAVGAVQAPWLLAKGLIELAVRLMPDMAFCHRWTANTCGCGCTPDRTGQNDARGRNSAEYQLSCGFLAVLAFIACREKESLLPFSFKCYPIHVCATAAIFQYTD